MSGERVFDVRGNKEEFVPASFHRTQKQAQQWAEGFRDSNYLARVIPVAGGKSWKVVINDNRLGRNDPKQSEVSERLRKKYGASSVQSESYMLANKNNPRVRKTRIRAESKISASKMDEYDEVRRFSFWVGTVHLLAAVLMIIYANKDFIIGITSTFAAGPPGCVDAVVDPCERYTITNFDAQLAYWVAGFSLLSAFFHYLTVLPGVFESYRSELMKGRNPYRWIEYALSSTLMILIIMLVSGLTNLTALIGVAFANISMILFGWLSEIMNPPEREKTNWTAFWFGCIAGLGAWAALYGSLAINLTQLGVDWSAIPNFVWVILATQFALFNVFAINHALQFIPGFYSEGYLRGEKNYIWLSLISKSLLAWSLYINTLIL